jgi:hypothetical protein
MLGLQAVAGSGSPTETLPVIACDRKRQSHGKGCHSAQQSSELLSGVETTGPQLSVPFEFHPTGTPTQVFVAGENFLICSWWRRRDAQEYVTTRSFVCCRVYLFTARFLRCDAQVLSTTGHLPVTLYNASSTMTLENMRSIAQYIFPLAIMSTSTLLMANGRSTLLCQPFGATGTRTTLLS